MKLAFLPAAALLLAAPGFAQTATELLQSGIYDQETTGNLDEAISIYRQIVNSAGHSELAAQAQYRLAETFLQKGDLPTAAAEYQRLAQNYPDQQQLLRCSGTGFVRLLQGRPPRRQGSSIAATIITTSRAWNSICPRDGPSGLPDRSTAIHKR